MTDAVVRLAARDWIWLIAIVCGAAAGNVAMVYVESANTKRQIQERMDTLDDRWQQRTIALAADLKSDIRTLASNVPPDWFKGLVNRLQDRVDKQEGEITELKSQIIQLKNSK